MASASRSGRVTIPAGGDKTVIAAGLSGGSHAIYRFFNSGKEGDQIEIMEKGASAALAKLEWKDSVDVPVDKKEIVVKAGSKEAEVVYDFLGLT